MLIIVKHINEFMINVLAILDPAFISLNIQRDNWKIYNFQFIYK